MMIFIVYKNIKICTLKFPATYFVNRKLDNNKSIYSIFKVQTNEEASPQ